LTSNGLSPEHARLFQQQAEELAEYRRKVGEQALMIDLLKKLRGLATSQPESELSGLIATAKRSDLKRGRGK
jgi:hypothetical protein